MSFLIVLFFGFCALIIAFQVIPAVLLFIGMAKGLRRIEKEKAEK